MHTRGIEMEMTRVVKFEVDGSAGKSKLVGKVKAGINNLLVLRFTGSAFDNFYRDEYTTLVKVNDKSNCKATPDVCDSVVSYFHRETVAFIDS
ncbi:hypothetical protein CPC08DRAFT_710789 [Agrocybe pediades]|nr:hypothetical protein CPC08DRAFT_710789 [Agrocybe pediades]